jgi:hypothetical protein
MRVGELTIPKGEEKDRLEEVLRVISALKGVKKAFYLDRRTRTELARIERQAGDSGPLMVHNDGVLECLNRTHVACIVKDKTFRPPPHATVLLVDERGKVIGKELLRGETAKAQPGVRMLRLGKDFVIFYDGKAKGEARFVLPPVPFREVEEMEGTAMVVSSSPSTLGDLHIKRSAGLDDDPKLATILVGFDVR